jgi:WD40 repeat protein
VSQVFLSHSRFDSREAVAVKQWLIEQEPGLVDEIYLDLDPHTGIRPGERWKEALNKASARCEAVICLLSKNWLNSAECNVEFRYAENLHKAILCARLEPVPDTNITSEWQRCDLFPNHRPTTEVDIADGGEPVVFDRVGLQQLLDGLRTLGIAAEHFPWPPPDDPDRAPYRGWAPLEEVDAAVFFGRDALILRGLDVLHGMRSTGVESLFVILGPSGAGKSSFLRAGLLPRLRRDDRSFLPLPIVRPEKAVLTGELGLAASIHTLRSRLGLAAPMLGEIKNACHPEHVERLRDWLEEARQVARDRLLEVPAEQPAPTLVLPVDQAEELFNADAGPEAPRFLELLGALVQHDAGVTPAMVVAVTIRADRYEPLQTAPELDPVHPLVFPDLKPLPPAGYTEVITGPARRAIQAGRRLTVEPALVERLLADTAEGADALPLLALTLEWLHHDFGGDGDLTVAEYELMGGMAQVVQNEVDELLATDSEQRQAQLDVLHDAFIPWLATINPDNNEPMRRLARWEDLPAASHPLIQEMVDKRLLVKDTRDGQVVVEVALESLLRQWRELAAWLRDEGQDLKDADGLERAAADWRASGRDKAWLQEGSRLTEAETLAAKPGFRDRLDPARDYLQASRRREDDRLETDKKRQQAELQAAKEHAAALRKRSRILVTVLAFTAIIAVVAVMLGVQANHAQKRADERFREATSLRLVSEGESMLAGTRPGVTVQSYQELLAAHAIPSTLSGDDYLFAALNRERQLVKDIDTPATVMSVAFSPDGTRIAAGCTDGSIRVWNAATGQPIGPPLLGHEQLVTSVAFSPDGRRIVSGSKDDTVRLWDATTGQPIRQPLRGHDNTVMSVAFSPDGAKVASSGMDGTIRLWDASTGDPVGQPLRGHGGGVTRVAFSPDGTRIASGGIDQTVRLWDAATGQPIAQPLRGHDDWVMSVAFSPDGTRIASGSTDHTVRLWDVATGQPIGQPLRHDNQVTSVAFSLDGTRIASGGADNTVRLWDAATGRALDVLTGHRSAVETVAFSPDGRRLLSGGDDQGVRIWDASAGPPLLGHDDTVGAADFSADGRRIRSGSTDGSVRVWDATTGQPIGQPLRVADRVRFLDPFGEDRVVSAGDAGVRVWDAHTGKPIGEPLRAMAGLAAWNPKTGRIATQTEAGAIEVRDAALLPFGVPVWTGKLVTGFDISPDDRMIVTTSGDSMLRLWDVATGKPLGKPLAANGIIASTAFSPDGHLLAAGTNGALDNSENTLRLWDTRTFEPVGDPIHVDSAVSSSVFSPDGRILATGSADGTIRLWDVGDHKQLGVPLTGHTSFVSALNFSPDGTKLLSASGDHTLRQWPVYRDPTSALCAKLTTNMSHQQWRDWVSPDIDYIEACPGLPIAPDGSP